jgi:hypothetical protein
MPNSKSKQKRVRMKRHQHAKAITKRRKAARKHARQTAGK